MITLKEIKELTENNMHTEAYILGCKYLEPANPELAEELTWKLEALLRRQKVAGYMPQHLLDERYRLYNWMMSMSGYLPEEERKEFYMCF